MVILIDTNVLIDFLTAREPFYNSAFQVMEKCASGKTKGYIAFHSLPNLWYIFRKVPEKTRRLWLEKLCKILRVTSTSHESILKAIKMENFKDFEDCLQDKCAEEISADYIITRNISDFENSIIPAVEPTDWLQKLRYTQMKRDALEYKFNRQEIFYMLSEVVQVIPTNDYKVYVYTDDNTVRC